MVISSASVLALVSLVSIKEMVSASEQRRSRIALRWQAEGCAARALAAVDAALKVSADSGSSSVWANLDRMPIAEEGAATAIRCHVRLLAEGSGADINSLNEDRLYRLLLALGIPSTQAQALAAAALDWSDADDEPRPYGAEADWYRRAHRPEPRNEPFQSIEELRLVRGFDELPPHVDSLLMESLGVEGARISLSHASAAALASLPGFGTEAVIRTIERRYLTSAYLESGFRTTVTLIGLYDALSEQARSDLSAHAGTLASLTTPEPLSWRMIVDAAVPEAAGRSHVAVQIRIRIVRAGSGVAVVQTEVN